MADIARELEDFKAANRTFGGEWKLEMKGKNNSSSNQASSSCCSKVPAADPPPQSIPSATESTCKYEIDIYKNYYCSNAGVTWGGGDRELKRQRRMLKYKSYAAEGKLKSSLMDGFRYFRWMKNKYCQFVRGY